MTHAGPQAITVCLPWSAASQDTSPLPEGVEIVSWTAGEPPQETLQAEFVVPPFSAAVAGRLDRFSRLRVLQSPTAGVDWIRDFVPRGVVLCSGREAMAPSTAEWVVTAILSSLREIPAFVRQQDSQRWRPRRTGQLVGSRILIVGQGAVGRTVERYLSGFDVRIARVATTARDGVSGVIDLPKLLADADIVVLCVPITDRTRALVDRTFLAAMPDGALLVNAARGPLVVADDLLAELSSGRLRAAVDVTIAEPLPPDDPLWRARGLLLTPHVAASTRDAAHRIRAVVRDQVDRYICRASLHDAISADY